MLHTKPVSKPGKLIQASYLFALIAGLCGAAFGLVSAPEHRANRALAIAAEAFTAGHYDSATRQAAEAVRLDPANPATWQLLALAAEESGRGETARRIRKLSAVRKGGAKPEPVYAAPADLRLSALSRQERTAAQ